MPIDSVGNALEVGDVVIVPDPNDSDIHNHEFVGTVTNSWVSENTHEEFATVVDDNGDEFDFEPDRLTKAVAI